MKVPKVCEECKQWYLARKNRVKTSKLCSKICQMIWMGRKSGKILHRKWALETEEETNLKRKISFERFFEKTEECWIWTGAKKNYGKKLPYGSFSFRGKRNRPAHRVSYEIYIGEIPEGKIIMHICDEPPCVNPDHLKVGTYLENQRDKLSKGRCKVEKLSIEQVKEIKKLLSMGVMMTRLSKDFNVSRQTIHCIKTGKTWSDIK